MPRLLTFPIVGFAFSLLLCSAVRLQAAPKSEAYVGKPFGVGSVTIDVLRGEAVLPLSDERFTVLEAQGRICCPVLRQENVRRIIRGLLDIEAPRKVTVYYLFQGDDPFDLSAFTPHEQGLHVEPRHDAAGHRRLLKQWWAAYTAHYHDLLSKNSYPPVAENFLVASLARRLDLSMPKPRRGFFSESQLFSNSLSDTSPTELFIDESRLISVDWTMLQQVSAEQFELTTLPQSIQWPEETAAEPELDDVVFEAMATHVPAECFYVRFGNFTNYLWFRDLNKKWQGDLGNMILRRGIRRGAGDRLEQQLALHETALSKLLGPQVISDAAIIGLDHYIGQGAAIGILFQAKNEFLLSTNMSTQRREALTKFDDAQEETLDIAGHSVSLISTPDSKVRSYYVKHDGFHLVTTSRTLIERFLQAAQGDRSLASLPSFQRMRQHFPLERDDTIVAFISEKYWQNLSSPHYIIENFRRLRSSREALLLELAQYVAQCEGKVAPSTEELIAAGILPANFGLRVDGSQLLFSDGIEADSLRGARGYYVPIADMTVQEVSKLEQSTFQVFTEKLKAGTGGLPPLAVAVHRTPLQLAEGDTEARETISFEMHAAGPMRKKLGSLVSWMGTPVEKKLQPVAGDLIAGEVIVNFPTALANQEDSEQQHLFGALRDFRAPQVIRQGKLQHFQKSTELVRGYLGAWPKPGLLSWLTANEIPEGTEPQPAGTNMWQAKLDDFLLLSFKPEVVKEVLPQLKMAPIERSGQFWLQVQDLTDTLMAENVSAWGYAETRKSSAAASRMMNALANQLRIPRNECRAVAERLVDGTFICPLGGEYQLYAPERGLEIWISSVLPAPNRFLLAEIPAEYQLPMLSWFRGLHANLKLDEESLDVRVEITTTSEGVN